MKLPLFNATGWLIPKYFSAWSCFVIIDVRNLVLRKPLSAVTNFSSKKLSNLCSFTEDLDFNCKFSKFDSISTVSAFTSADASADASGSKISSLE